MGDVEEDGSEREDGKDGYMDMDDDESDDHINISRLRETGK